MTGGNKDNIKSRLNRAAEERLEGGAEASKEAPQAREARAAAKGR